MMLPTQYRNFQLFIFIIAAGLCLLPSLPAAFPLVCGFAVARSVGHPFQIGLQKIQTILLQVAVVGLGFGMNAAAVLRVGRENFAITVAFIALTLALGRMLSQQLKVNAKTGYLISVGTAICGGSAIAAIAQITRPRPAQLSTALAVVFVFNSLALTVFPFVGHWLALSQEQFGLWCAVAIHDTSSVVAAAGAYGAKALEVAVTSKLLRALWIVPVSVGTLIMLRKDYLKARSKAFIFAAAFMTVVILNSVFPFMHPLSAMITISSYAVLKLTLFLIGASVSWHEIKKAGMRSLVLGLALWLTIAGAALIAILYA